MVPEQRRIIGLPVIQYATSPVQPWPGCCARMGEARRGRRAEMLKKALDGIMRQGERWRAECSGTMFRIEVR